MAAQQSTGLPDVFFTVRRQGEDWSDFPGHCSKAQDVDAAIEEFKQDCTSLAAEGLTSATLYKGPWRWDLKFHEVFDPGFPTSDQFIEVAEWPSALNLADRVQGSNNKTIPPAPDSQPAPERGLADPQDVHILRLIKEQFDLKLEQTHRYYKTMIGEQMMGRDREEPDMVWDPALRKIMFEFLPYNDTDEFWDWLGEQGVCPDVAYFSYQLDDLAIHGHGIDEGYMFNEHLCLWIMHPSDDNSSHEISEEDYLALRVPESLK
eukprot:SAG22_NODE_211_length_15079_cov_14.083906_3_plen_262_part_00